MFGRTVVQDGVSIDMREVSHIYVDKASHTAQVGGGVINLDLHRELDKHKMTTAHAVTPSVGYTGWAIHGGYGLLSNNYGLGSDQIVGARVVDGHGNIVDADETLLTAIRGGGGSVAVIYELLIKVYPSEKVRWSYSHRIKLFWILNTKTDTWGILRLPIGRFSRHDTSV